MTDCYEKSIFKKIIDGDIPAKKLEETDDYIIIEDINPKAPMHVLIIPKKEIPGVRDALDEDCEILGKLILAARNFAKKHKLSHGFRLVINNGIDAGETIPHLHIHLFAGRPMIWPPC